MSIRIWRVMSGRRPRACAGLRSLRRLSRLAALRTLFVSLGLSRGGSLSFADRRFATPPTALRLWAPPSYGAEGGTGPQLQRHPSASAKPTHGFSPIQADRSSTAPQSTLPWIGVCLNRGDIQADLHSTDLHGILAWIGMLARALALA